MKYLISIILLHLENNMYDSYNGINGMFVKGELKLICDKSNVGKWFLNHIIESISEEFKESSDLRINFSPLSEEYRLYKSVLNWYIKLKNTDNKFIYDINDDYITQCNLILDELWMDLTTNEKIYVTLYG